MREIRQLRKTIGDLEAHQPTEARVSLADMTAARDRATTRVRKKLRAMLEGRSVSEGLSEQEQQDEELIRRWHEQQGIDYDVQCRESKRKLLEELERIRARLHQKPSGSR